MSAANSVVIFGASRGIGLGLVEQAVGILKQY
jgi:NAD(P)-dependent dehydrogenase (short-subunit alcohol dehydrogenase family)